MSPKRPESGIALIPLGLRRLGFPLICALLLSSCASIKKFELDRRLACSGDKVLVAWDASGKVSLESEPVLPGTGAVPSRGERGFRVDRRTAFTITARRIIGKPKSIKSEVDVSPEVHRFGEVASCSTSTMRMTALMRLGDQYSPTLKAATVKNYLPRSLTVETSGRSVVLSSNSVTSEFGGLPLAGDWVLISPLGARETCESALESVRQRLRGEIRIHCQ